MADFLDQFGAELYSPSTKENVKTSDALTGKTVLLYFSAHWCPPCRRFTPMLINFYKSLKKDNFELVFVSLDRTEAEFNEYVADMPWKCIPFSVDAGVKQKIAMKYGASGIPHLVVVDKTPDRKVITSEGVSEVQLDPEGKNFPWRPKSLSEIWPKKFLTKNGLADSSTLENKYLMLYFSAHWCPPCRQFTPKLSEFYKTLKAQRDDFELVFVSSDRDSESFAEYFGEMSFCALPFDEREAKALLSKRFGVNGIPHLLILGPVPEGGGDRPLINDNLRGAVELGDLSDFPFEPKPYQDFSAGAEGINEYRSLVIFCENEDDDEQKDIIEAVKTVAVKSKASGDAEMKFFFATEPTGLATQVRRVIKMENKYDSVVMALLDIPDNGGYYVSDETEITADAIEAFLANPGQRQQLSR